MPSASIYPAAGLQVFIDVDLPLHYIISLLSFPQNPYQILLILLPIFWIGFNVSADQLPFLLITDNAFITLQRSQYT